MNMLKFTFFAIADEQVSKLILVHLIII